MTRIKIKPVIAYEVEREDGESLGRFTVASEWQGMICLTDSIGRTLIVEDVEPSFIHFLTGKYEGKIIQVIKASHNLLKTFNPT